MEITGTYKLFAYEPPGAFSTVTCDLIKTSRCGDREDLVWVNLRESRQFGLGDLADKTLLATRHEGDDLRFVKELPIHVYVLLVAESVPELAEEIEPDDIRIGFWALLLNVNDERTDLESILSQRQSNLR